MTHKTFIMIALIALFSSTAYSQDFLGMPPQVQTTATPVQEGVFDELWFGGNEEEMSLEEGEFSNEEGEFLHSEEEMVLVGDEIPSIPALSDLVDGDMLDDIWVGISEEEMSFEEGEFHNEEGEFLHSEEEMVLVGGEIPSIPALSDLVDGDMIDQPWIGASEEEMNFEGEFVNEEGELALNEGEFSNEEAEFNFHDLDFSI